MAMIDDAWFPPSMNPFLPASRLAEIADTADDTTVHELTHYFIPTVKRKLEAAAKNGKYEADITFTVSSCGDRSTANDTCYVDCHKYLDPVITKIGKMLVEAGYSFNAVGDVPYDKYVMTVKFSHDK